MISLVLHKDCKQEKTHSLAWPTVPGAISVFTSRHKYIAARDDVGSKNILNNLVGHFLKHADSA